MYILNIDNYNIFKKNNINIYSLRIIMIIIKRLIIEIKIKKDILIIIKIISSNLFKFVCNINITFMGFISNCYNGIKGIF